MNPPTIPTPLLIVFLLASHAHAWTDLASAVPNLDFEEYTVLPNGLSEMNFPGQTVTGWFDMIDSTTDYLHFDRYVGQGRPLFSQLGMGYAPPPPNRSKGFIGAYSRPTAPNIWNEYAAQVLPAPLIAGEEYRLDMWAGTTDGTGSAGGAFQGSLAVYGIYDASLIPGYDVGYVTTPITTFAAGNVEVLLELPVDLPLSSWQAYPNVSFTPTQPIEAIAFGPSRLASHHQWQYMLFDVAGANSLPGSFLAGDYNDNGEVDAADYVAWRKAKSIGAYELPNDATPFLDTGKEFAFWKSRFGDTLSPGSGAIATPEPSAIALAVIGFLLLVAAAAKHTANQR